MTMGDVERNNVPRKDFRVLLMYMDIVNTITNICLGGAAFAAIIFAQVPGVPTVWRSHIVLVTLGYLLMLTQTLTSINKATGWTRMLKDNPRKIAHLVVELMGVTMVIAGTSLAVANPLMPLASMSSHGIVGLTALALTVLTTLGGIANFFLSENTPLPTGLIHLYLGSLALIIGFIAFTMGVHKIYMYPTATLVSVLAIIGLIGTISNAFLSRFKLK